MCTFKTADVIRLNIHVYLALVPGVILFVRTSEFCESMNKMKVHKFLHQRGIKSEGKLAAANLNVKIKNVLHILWYTPI